jgi:large subunit ribosomal protein L13
MEYIFDATGKRFGRLASEVAVILMGKKTPKYNPRLIGGDKVIVKNIKKVTFSGANKMINKVYYRHTGYMGHLKSQTLKEAWNKDPAKVFRQAVVKMLPKNTLASKRLKNLIIEK